MPDEGWQNMSKEKKNSHEFDQRGVVGGVHKSEVLSTVKRVRETPYVGAKLDGSVVPSIALATWTAPVS